MFVDASALVAILTGESDASDLAARLEGATTLITSPIAVYESVLAIARIKQGGIGEARIDGEMFLAAVPIRVVAVTPLDGPSLSTRSKHTERDEGTRRSSTWVIASPMPQPRTTASRSSSRAGISSTPISRRL